MKLLNKRILFPASAILLIIACLSGLIITLSNLHFFFQLDKNLTRVFFKHPEIAQTDLKSAYTAKELETLLTYHLEARTLLQALPSFHETALLQEINSRCIRMLSAKPGLVHSEYNNLDNEFHMTLKDLIEKTNLKLSDTANSSIVIMGILVLFIALLLAGFILFFLRYQEASTIKYQAMLSQSGDAVFITDLNGKILEVNQKASNLLELPIEQILSLNCRDVLPVEGSSKDKNTSLIDLCLSGMGRLQTFISTRSGHIIPVDITCSVINLRHQKIIKANVRDITNIKTIEKQLKDALDFSQKIIDIAPFGLGVYYKTGDCIYVNDSMCGIFDLPKAYLMSSNYYNLAFWKETGMLEKATEAINLNKTNSFEQDLKLNDYKTINAEFHFIPFMINQKTHLLLIVNNLTEMKLKENQIRKYAQELIRSNKDLENFAYIASHDLQEPIRTISSFLQLLEQKNSQLLDEKSRDYIMRAVAASRRMQNMIEDLLTYSRIMLNTNKTARIDTNDILKAALENLSTTILKKSALITFDSLPVISADENQLTRLFQNLISNAIKFCTSEKPVVHISCKDNGEYLEFSIKDNGIGIDPKYHDKIFKIFQRLNPKEQYQGSGIGLAVAKKIVERHGGTIRFDSEPGKGSTFYFTIRKQEQKHESYE